MLRFSALVAAASIPVAGAAAHAEPVIVEKDGYRFSYEAHQLPDGVVRLAGRMDGRAEEFELLIQPDGRVIGDVGGRQVRFRVSRAKRERVVNELALARREPADLDLAKSD